MDQTTRQAQVYARFAKFFRENPHIWELFQRFAHQIINAGHAHYSAMAIFNRIRWHVAVETREEHGFKVSNDYTPYYARLFHLAHPQHTGFFRLHKLPTAERPAYQVDKADHGEPAGPEPDLEALLAELLQPNGDTPKEADGAL
jgi:hypothetical protein